jgi:hypothetical protein
MAYNINFCEGNLEAVPAWFWCSLKNKTKNPYSVCKPYTTLIWQKKKNNYASIDPKKYNRHNKNYS